MSGRGATDLTRFRAAYAGHRAEEGRGDRAELLSLPYATGAHARTWAVRARTFDRFIDLVVTPRAALLRGRRLRVLDLGAGSGWLCYRLAQLGHDAVAIDLRDDDVDGLAAGTAYATLVDPLFGRVAASFEALPVRADTFDIAAFNASLHYALSLHDVLAEAARVVGSGGVIAILDSPFYTRGRDGAAMVAEKRATAHEQFGERAADLMALPFIEYLTRQRLEHASAPLGLSWRRHAVRYPLWYELRPLVAALRRRRAPSRFDLWVATVP